jgi:hypothetical protein
MLKLGVIGTYESGAELSGMISGQTACRLTGLFDPDPDLSRQLPNGHEIPFLTSYKAFLSRCEAVIVDRINSLKPDHIIQALRDSKHVLLARPVEWTEDELEYLYKLADEANTLLKLRQPFLFHPVIQAARPLVQNPAFINYQINISAENETEHLQERIATSLYQCLDAILYLNPARITRSNTVLAPDLFGFPGVIHGRVEFDNGCISNITCDGYAEQGKSICTLYQENRQCVLNFTRNRLTIKDKIPGEEKPRTTNVPVKRKDPVVEEIKYFINLVINKNYHLVPFHSYYQSLSLGKQMMQNLPSHPVGVL